MQLYWTNELHVNLSFTNKKVLHMGTTSRASIHSFLQTSAQHGTAAEVHSFQQLSLISKTFLEDQLEELTWSVSVFENALSVGYYSQVIHMQWW